MPVTWEGRVGKCVNVCMIITCLQLFSILCIERSVIIIYGRGMIGRLCYSFHRETVDREVQMHKCVYSCTILLLYEAHGGRDKGLRKRCMYGNEEKEGDIK